MPGTIAPFPKHQLFDANGDPAAGYKLFTYASGTTTKQTTYSDADLTAANTNPIILDAAGRATIFLAAQNYKFVLAPPNDTDPPAAPVWTVDGVSAIAAFNVDLDVPCVAGENISFGEVCFMADGLGGLIPGRWYRAEANNAAFWKAPLAPVIGFPTTNLSTGASGAMRIAGRVTNIGPLATGSRYYVSNFPPGTLTFQKLGAHRLVGQADSTSSLILMPHPLQFRQLHITFGTPGGGVLTTGVKHYVFVTHPMLVTGWTIIAEQAGSVVIDVWSREYTGFPPTVVDTIAGSEKPELVAQQNNRDDTLATWTYFVPAENVLAFNIDSAATVNYVSLTIDVLMY